MPKKLNKTEVAAAQILGGYMRSKIDANALQPAIFSEMVGKDIQTKNSAVTIQSAIRNKLAKKKLNEEFSKKGIYKSFKQPNLPVSAITEENLAKPYDDISDEELVKLKFSLPAGGYKASWSREHKDIYNAVNRRKFKKSFRKVNEDYVKARREGKILLEGQIQVQGNMPSVISKEPSAIQNVKEGRNIAATKLQNAYRARIARDIIDTKRIYRDLEKDMKKYPMDITTETPHNSEQKKKAN